ncbi:hypothetical protein CVT25_011161 [Psilocybe cyanescens]|uniref:Uncharacterized protein n=1 Tax=Psilocybe cyanescens TaxID=93625 RepID=A0A409WGV6_PSICY|nr:hypothetical protein CVT25_011161 [Psilocybe cyanescens]
MFALRASCSSTLTATKICPRFVARLSQGIQNSGNSLKDTSSTSETTVASFLEESDSASGSATPFDIAGPPEADGPPTASGGFYSKANANANLTPRHTLANPISRVDLPEYKLHCHSSRNNTIVTFTKPDGSTIAWFSGGSTASKFKKGNRASYEAGYQCAKAIFSEIRKWHQQHENFKLELFFKGFGEGREAMRTALLAAEGTEIRPLVCRVTDRTPIKIGGTRAKKTRRG